MNPTSKTILSALLLGFLTTAIGCRQNFKVESDDVSSDSLVISFAASSDQNWEKTIARATIFIYRQSDSSPSAAPVVKYILSTQDLARGSALIPMFPDFLVGSEVDLHAVVNSRDTNIYRSNKSYTRAELARLYDSSAFSRYNSSSYNELQNTIVASGGFAMSGSTAATIQSGDAPSIPIKIELTRTVARVDVNVATVEADFRDYVTDIGQPSATLRINSAWMLRTNRRAPIFDEQTAWVDDYQAPYSRRDSIGQDNDRLLPALYVGEFRFYTLPTSERGDIHYPFFDDNTNSAIKLIVRTLYDADGDATTTSDARTINFILPFQAGDNPFFAPAVMRNTLYQVNVQIKGIGEAIGAARYSGSTKSGARCELNYIVGLGDEDI